MAEPNNVIQVPGIGPVVLVDREKLRRKTDRRFFRRPSYRGMAELAPLPLPTTLDQSKGETIKYPVLGNDQEGDCYYAAILHIVQNMVGQWGPQPNWNVQDVLRRYETLSGGDNGLSDDDVYPEWKKGILGPNGPHKIVDSLLISPTDTHAIKTGIFRFGGCLFTCSLPGGWANNASPGATWDASNAGGSVGGHAIIFTGYQEVPFDLRTWGISPPIHCTPAGIAAVDPEIIVVFSPENYSPDTRLSPAGATWEEDRALWIQYGGRDVGPAPWGPVVPPVPPSPPVPPGPPVPPSPPIPPSPPPAPVVSRGVAQTQPYSFHSGGIFGQTVTIPGQTIPLTVTSVVGGSAGPESVAWLAVYRDVLRIVTDFSANAPIQTLEADLLQLARDLGVSSAMPNG